jgi:hypothetical protein
MNIATHPIILFKSRVWDKMNHAAIVPKTDSMDNIIAAGAGCALL